MALIGWRKYSQQLLFIAEKSLNELENIFHCGAWGGVCVNSTLPLLPRQKWDFTFSWVLVNWLSLNNKSKLVYYEWPLPSRDHQMTHGLRLKEANFMHFLSAGTIRCFRSLLNSPLKCLISLCYMLNAVWVAQFWNSIQYLNKWINPVESTDQPGLSQHNKASPPWRGVTIDYPWYK